MLLVPVYNENVTEVFARIQAIRESLREAGAEKGFDFFVLSDSTDAACRAAEEAAWRRAREDNCARIFYRNRADNTGHKAGNIADFCRNWGAMYDYMVVLDADSLMTGRRLARLVALMDANPRTALIQAAPLLVGGESLFARSQQFASWAYGRMFAAGLAKLQGPDGNYWGHNAIIRVRPFMEHCGLPILRGRPPLGGEIMSHDFVEAALLRRAGWEVWMAPEFEGSYETSPPTLIDHLKRDRRWCQGNLQHIRLLFAQGLHMPNRLHMAFGALSYLSSPLWLMLILLFSAHAANVDRSPVTYVGRYPVLAWPISHTVAFVSIAVAAMLLLYVPKIMALIVLLRDREAVRGHGGAAQAHPQRVPGKPAVHFGRAGIHAVAQLVRAEHPDRPQHPLGRAAAPRQYRARQRHHGLRPAYRDRPRCGLFGLDLDAGRFLVVPALAGGDGDRDPVRLADQSAFYRRRRPPRRTVSDTERIDGSCNRR